MVFLSFIVSLNVTLLGLQVLLTTDPVALDAYANLSVICVWCLAYKCLQLNRIIAMLFSVTPSMKRSICYLNDGLFMNEQPLWLQKPKQHVSTERGCLSNDGFPSRFLVLFIEHYEQCIDCKARQSHLYVTIIFYIACLFCFVSFLVYSRFKHLR